MDVITHNLSRIRVRHKTQIRHTFLGWQIGDVSHPDLFRAAWHDLFNAWLEQIWMTSKAMMAIGRFVISPLASH